MIAEVKPDRGHKVWHCPKCGHRLETPVRIKAASHRCPHYHGARVVDQVPVEVPT